MYGTGFKHLPGLYYGSYSSDTLPTPINLPLLPPDPISTTLYAPPISYSPSCLLLLSFSNTAGSFPLRAYGLLVFSSKKAILPNLKSQI